MDNPLRRHGVHIAQLKKSGDKGRGVTGVHKYSRRGLRLKHLAVLCEAVEPVDYFLEMPRYIDVSRTGLIVRHAVSLHLFQWMCLEPVEGRIVRINVLVFHLALLMDVSLGTVVATGLPADAPGLVKDFLFLLCKLRLLHLLLALLVKELAHALDFVVGLLEVLLFLVSRFLQGFDDGRQFGGLGQQLVNPPCKSVYLVVGILQLVHQRCYDFVLCHSTKVLNLSDNQVCFGDYFTDYFTVYQTVRFALNFNPESLAVSRRPDRNTLHDQRKRLPGHPVAPSGLVELGYLEGALLKAFLVKDKAVGVPAKQLDALMVLAIKDENAARKGRHLHF